MSAFFEELARRLQARPEKLTVPMAPEWRESAVLVPILMRSGEPHLLFTKRPVDLRLHGGEISFPGGGQEPGDTSPVETALRETEEELGLHREKIKVLGMLDESLTRTFYRIVPVVGEVASEVEYRPNAREVQEILELPFAAFTEACAHHTESRELGGTRHVLHSYTCGPHVVWGATAQIVWNLLQITGDLSH